MCEFCNDVGIVETEGEVIYCPICQSAGYQDVETSDVFPTTADCENALRDIAKEEGADLKGKLIVAEAREAEFRNHAIHLADALMDINNLVGEDEHVKQAVERVDALMREYAGLELEYS